MVKDIRPGSAGSTPGHLFNFDGQLLFRANDGSTGVELWTSDGSEGGTFLLRNIAGGSDSSQIQNFTRIGDEVWFSADDGDGTDVWITDGTTQGTQLGFDINGSGDSDPAEFTLFEGDIYFAATENFFGRELWRSDGNVAGLIFDIQPGTFSSNPALFEATTTHLFYTAQDPNAGRELFTVNEDGTSSLYANFFPGSIGSSIGEILRFSDTEVIFNADNGVNGDEVWISNGTVGGTSLLADINPGTASSAPDTFTLFDGRVFFRAFTPSFGTELWATDGTPGNTGIVRNIRPGDSSSGIGEMVVVPGLDLMFFRARGQNGGELWATDGTQGGTFEVKDINPGGGFSDPEQLAALGSRLVFTADDGSSGRELWISDGTEEGTQRITDLRAGSASPDIQWLTVVGDAAYFSADNGVDGAELFVFELDNARPEVTSIIPATVGPTNATSVTFTVTFSEEVQNFNDADDVIVTHTGTQHGDVSVMQQTGSTYVVTVSGLSGAGTFTIGVDPDSDVSDLFGNALTEGGTSVPVNIDTVPPMTTIGGPTTGVGGSLFYALTQSDGTGSAITNVTVSARPDGGDWTNLGETTGSTFTWTPPSSGRWFLQSLGIDSVGNAEPGPSGTGDLTLVYNQTPNAALFVPMAAGETVTFPMTGVSSVTIDLANGTPGGTIGVARDMPAGFVPPQLSGLPLLNESVTVLGTLASGTADLTWTYDPSSDDTLGGPPDTVWYVSFTGAVTPYTSAVSGNQLSVSGVAPIDGLWLAGRTEGLPPGDLLLIR